MDEIGQEKKRQWHLTTSSKESWRHVWRGKWSKKERKKERKKHGEERKIERKRCDQKHISRKKERKRNWLIGWLVGFSWHINLCRLFNARSICMQIVSSISKKFSLAWVQFNCQKHLYLKLFNLFKQF